MRTTNDDIVESCYPGYPFSNDEARLECLFKLYEKMTKTKPDSLKLFRGCRKRSIPTHSERLNPPTIIAKMALKSA
ncbi:hypothetical protein [uncultured Bacteroides sp.]|uniref:hypothetical protein n=1 Tax=uncultured Bacteroides sp. TaxID=162156 RepID=UPI002613F810|nr:hypothetical protein [uncultured Bacteroides sp.]